MTTNAVGLFSYAAQSEFANTAPFTGTALSSAVHTHGPLDRVVERRGGVCPRRRNGRNGADALWLHRGRGRDEDGGLRPRARKRNLRTFDLDPELCGVVPDGSARECLRRFPRPIGQRLRPLPKGAAGGLRSLQHGRRGGVCGRDVAGGVCVERGGRGGSRRRRARGRRAGHHPSFRGARGNQRRRDVAIFGGGCGRRGDGRYRRVSGGLHGRGLGDVIHFAGARRLHVAIAAAESLPHGRRRRGVRRHFT